MHEDLRDESNNEEAASAAGWWWWWLVASLVVVLSLLSLQATIFVRAYREYYTELSESTAIFNAECRGRTLLTPDCATTMERIVDTLNVTVADRWRRHNFDYGSGAVGGVEMFWQSARKTGLLFAEVGAVGVEFMSRYAWLFMVPAWLYLWMRDNKR